MAKRRTKILQDKLVAQWLARQPPGKYDPNAAARLMVQKAAEYRAAHHATAPPPSPPQDQMLTEKIMGFVTAAILTLTILIGILYWH
jgi:hypothetical protein